jgi:hypothetical protein
MAVDVPKIPVMNSPNMVDCTILRKSILSSSNLIVRASELTQMPTDLSSDAGLVVLMV